MTKRHFKLFLCLHSILVISNTNPSKTTTINKNRVARRPENGLSNEKDSSKSRMFKLLGTALKENEIQLIDHNETIDAKRPHYLSKNTWTNLIQLEKNAPNTFKDLSKSMSEDSKQWIEYFQINDSKDCSIDITEKEIDLINQSPLDADLSLTDKLTLWLCARPDKSSEILTKFNIYNLGGLMPTRLEFDIRTAYKISLGTVPFLITIPKNGILFEYYILLNKFKIAIIKKIIKKMFLSM